MFNAWVAVKAEVRLSRLVLLEGFVDSSASRMPALIGWGGFPFSHCESFYMPDGWYTLPRGTPRAVA